MSSSLSIKLRKSQRLTSDSSFLLEDMSAALDPPMTPTLPRLPPSPLPPRPPPMPHCSPRPAAIRAFLAEESLTVRDTGK